jgi:hypothetical protein
MITFTSPYCQTNCNQSETQRSQFLTAPTIPDPPRDYHDLPITGEPITAQTLNYKAPSVEDTDDDDDGLADQSVGTPLLITGELTANRNSYVTYSPYNPNVSRGIAHELEPIQRLEGCGPELRADWRVGIWRPASGLRHTSGWEESAQTGPQRLGIEGNAPQF